MRHTDDDVEQTARRFERIADELDPTTAEVDQTDFSGKLPPSPRHCVQTKPGCERPSKLPVPTAGHGIRSRSPLECPGKQPASGSPTKHPHSDGFHPATTSPSEWRRMGSSSFRCVSSAFRTRTCAGSWTTPSPPQRLRTWRA